MPDLLRAGGVVWRFAVGRRSPLVARSARVRGEALDRASDRPALPLAAVVELLRPGGRGAAEFGGTKDFFVVVRARHDLQPEGGSHGKLKKPTAQEKGGPRDLVVGPWALARGYVCSDRGEIVAEAVFHGFATRAESEAYWRAAVEDISLPTLPPHRI